MELAGNISTLLREKVPYINKTVSIKNNDIFSLVYVVKVLYVLIIIFLCGFLSSSNARHLTEKQSFNPF